MKASLLWLWFVTLASPVMSYLRLPRQSVVSRPIWSRLLATTKEKSGAVKALVIVESPTKARTIENFLQSNDKYKDYIIDSCAGHIREISHGNKDGRVIDTNLNIKVGDFAIDVFENFQPDYKVISQKEDVIRRLKGYSKQVSEILLATDEDREGEAISWHLVECLKPSIPYKRVVFHEITKSAIEKAFAEPREIDINLVYAQEARSILDKIAGFTLSPLLWRFIWSGLSAGRVQSCGLKLIAEKEKQRWEFKSSHYHSIDAMFASPDIPGPIQARLYSFNTLRIAAEKDFDGLTGEIKASLKEKVKVLDTEESKLIMDELSTKYAEGLIAFQVSNKQTKTLTKSPAVPFITSTLQQESSRKLGYSPSRTMQLAQGLYERGYISYMRTDSPTLSENARAASFKMIEEMFGKEYIANEKDKKKKDTQAPKNAQEAHEAIRPAETNGLFKLPADVKEELNADEWALYNLIFKRTLASLMKPSESLCITLSISTVDKIIVKEKAAKDELLFRCSMTTVSFPGYLKVWDREGFRNYEENDFNLLDIGSELDLVQSTDIWTKGKTPSVAVEEEGGEEEGEDLVTEEEEEEKNALKLLYPGLRSVGHATMPPGRYTESSFIHALETIGVGRPSTYSNIMSILKDREYIKVDKQSLIPTVKGLLVSQFLEENFRTFVNEEFTANMEAKLDAIAKGEEEKVKFLSQFYFGLPSPPTYPVDQKQIDNGLLKTASSLLERNAVVKKEQDDSEPKAYRTLTIPYLADLGKIRFSKNGLLFATVSAKKNDIDHMWKLPLIMEQDIREITREKILEIMQSEPSIQGSFLGVYPTTNEQMYIKHGRYGKYLDFTIPDPSGKKSQSRTFTLPYSWSNLTSLEEEVSLDDITTFISLPKDLGKVSVENLGDFQSTVKLLNRDLHVVYAQLTETDGEKTKLFMLPFPSSCSLAAFNLNDASTLLLAHMSDQNSTQGLESSNKLISLSECRQLGKWRYLEEMSSDEDASMVSVRYGRFGYYLHATGLNIVCGLGKNPVETIDLDTAIELLQKKKEWNEKQKTPRKTAKKKAVKSTKAISKKGTKVSAKKVTKKIKVGKDDGEEGVEVKSKPRAKKAPSSSTVKKPVTASKVKKQVENADQEGTAVKNPTRRKAIVAEDLQIASDPEMVEEKKRGRKKATVAP